MDTPPPINPGSPSVPPTPPAIDSNQWKVYLYVSGLAGLLIPIGNIVAPLILWLIKKEESSEIDAAGRLVLNFQISYTIYAIVSSVVAATLFFLIIPLLLPFAVFIAWIVFMIKGALNSSKGLDYQPPFTLKML